MCDLAWGTVLALTLPAASPTPTLTYHPLSPIPPTHKVQAGLGGLILTITLTPTPTLTLTRCKQLSEDVVRNGEGTRHVIRVAVCGTSDEQLACGEA